MSQQSNNERLTGITAALFVEEISIREGMQRAWQAGRESAGNPPQADNAAAVRPRGHGTPSAPDPKVEVNTPLAIRMATLDGTIAKVIRYLEVAEAELDKSRGIRADKAKAQVMLAFAELQALLRGSAL